MAFNVGDTVVIYTKKSFFSSTPYSFDIVKEISGGGFLWYQVQLFLIQMAVVNMHNY